MQKSLVFNSSFVGQSSTSNPAFLDFSFSHSPRERLDLLGSVLLRIALVAYFLRPVLIGSLLRVLIGSNSLRYLYIFDSIVQIWLPRSRFWGNRIQLWEFVFEGYDFLVQVFSFKCGFRKFLFLLLLLLAKSLKFIFLCVLLFSGRYSILSTDQDQAFYDVRPGFLKRYVLLFSFQFSFSGNLNGRFHTRRRENDGQGVKTGWIVLDVKIALSCLRFVRLLRL